MHGEHAGQEHVRSRERGLNGRRVTYEELSEDGGETRQTETEEPGAEGVYGEGGVVVERDETEGIVLLRLDGTLVAGLVKIDGTDVLRDLVGKRARFAWVWERRNKRALTSPIASASVLARVGRSSRWPFSLSDESAARAFSSTEASEALRSIVAMSINRQSGAA